jgi:uncharacterized protein with HEPN domain
MAASKNPLLRLEHMRDEIRLLSASLTAVDRERYVGNYLLRRASERALLIISEAAKALPREMLERYPEADWSAIATLGNVLRHEYHMVDDDTIWEIVSVDLPNLAPIVDRMIHDLSS